MSWLPSHVAGNFHGAYACHFLLSLWNVLRLSGALVKSQWAYFSLLQLYKPNQGHHGDEINNSATNLYVYVYIWTLYHASNRYFPRWNKQPYVFELAKWETPSIHPCATRTQDLAAKFQVCSVSTWLSRSVIEYFKTLDISSALQNRWPGWNTVISILNISGALW